jgi:hypothetical protein
MESLYDCNPLDAISCHRAFLNKNNEQEMHIVVTIERVQLCRSFLSVVLRYRRLEDGRCRKSFTDRPVLRRLDGIVGSLQSLPTVSLQHAF